MAQDGTSSQTIQQGASAIEALLGDDLNIVETPAPKPPAVKAAPKPEPVEQPDPAVKDGDVEELEAAKDEVEPQDDPEHKSDEQDPAPPKTRKLKVDGEEIEVTEEELEKGYSRHADYTRKTMALAEKQKQLDLEVTDYREARSAYAESLQKLKAKVDDELGPEPDWDKLKATDPIAYAEQYADRQRKKERIETVRREQDRVAQEEAEEHDTLRHQYAEGQRARLLERIPDWKKPEVAKKEQAEIREYAIRNVGMSAEEVDGILDHRAVVALRKAMLFDRAQQKAATLEDKAVKANENGTLKPGAKTNQPVTPQATRDKQRLAKTGRVKDAARAFESLGIFDD